MNNCLNCSHPLSEGQHFCSNCGQKIALKRLNLHDIWHDVIHYFTHADKGIFQLLKALATQTGTVAREYVSGKRKKYFPPLNFFLIVAALYVFMGSVIPSKPASSSKNTYGNSYQEKSVIKESTTNYSAAQKQASVGRFFKKYSNFVAMFAAPFISLIIWLILIRGPYNFTEHLVANLYLIGFTNLVRCMFWSPLIAVLQIDPTIQWPIFVFAVFEVAYRSVFYYQFIGNFTTTGKLKASALAILSVIAWWVLISSIIFIYMMI